MITVSCGLKEKNLNSREATNYLKALTILAVLANHFISEYVTDSLGGYGNGFISIFFLLSGYGIYNSLRKQSDKPLSEFLYFFIKKRLMRIYPLFWIWCVLHGFPDGILGFFALDFLHPKTAWFIPFIMQCYIVAPFLFTLTNRFKLKYSIPIVFSAFIFINILLYSTGVSPARTVGFGFRRIFFLHIFQFYLGYILAKIEQDSSCTNYFVYVNFLLLTFFVQETTPQAFLSFPGKSYIFPILLSFFVFAFCFSILSSQIIFPFQKVMNFIGTHTLSIYLFHGIGFKVLSYMGVIHHLDTSFIGIVIWILSLPLLILILAAIETTVNEFVFGKKNIKNAFDLYLKKLSINAQSKNVTMR